MKKYTVKPFFSEVLSSILKCLNIKHGELAFLSGKTNVDISADDVANWTNRYINAFVKAWNPCW